MKRFIQGEHRGQSTLVPESLDDYVSDTNPVRVVDVFVDELDLVSLGFESATPADTGRPAYHPAILPRIYIYGLCEGRSGSSTMRPAYVVNLRWDVLAWNAAADKVFAFLRVPTERRDFLWLLFTATSTRALLDPWEDQASQILSSFRRDFVRAAQNHDIGALVKDLERIDTDFRT